MTDVVQANRDSGLSREMIHTHIEPSRGWVSLKFKELMAFRELLYFLTWRDIKVRYKQTALGAIWAILQPVMNMVVFSIFFGKFGKIASEGVPYPIFSYAALLPWGFFASALGMSSNSLVGNSNLITKVYFPRLVIPISSVLSGIVDFCLAFTVLIGMMFFFHMRFSWLILLLPLFLLLALITALGVSLWLSALNVQYRDVHYVVPFITQFWMFASPVIYSSQYLSEPWRSIYGLNPMVGVIEGFRWAMLGTAMPGPSIIISSVMSIIILITGLFYFRRMERTFADVV